MRNDVRIKYVDKKIISNNKNNDSNSNNNDVKAGDSHRLEKK